MFWKYKLCPRPFVYKPLGKPAMGKFTITKEKKMTIHKIRVEVSGASDDKVTALAGLLEEMCYEEKRDAIRLLSTGSLIALAKCVHGTIYLEIQGG